MNPAVITSIIGAVSSLIVALVSVYLSNRLIGYKVDQLEKKVEKHNNIVERIAVMEETTPASFNTVWRRYDDMRAEIDRLREEVKEL